MAKFNVKDLTAKLKANWSRPNEGEYLSIKEFASFCFGGMGIYTLTDAVGMLGFSGTSVVVGYIMGIGIKDAYIIGIIGTVLGYIIMPLNVMVTDNLGQLPRKVMRTLHAVSAALVVLSALLWVLPSARFDSLVKDLFKHTAIKIVCTIFGTYLNLYVLRFFSKKYGKFKPQMVLFGLPALALATFMVYLPINDLKYSSKLLLVHLITNLISSFSGPYGGNIEKLQGLLSSSEQERMRIYAIAPLALGLMRSVFGMLFPVFATFTGGQLNIVSYRWIIPAFGLYGLLQGFLVIKAKERVFQPPDFKPKVNLGKALKEVFSNKYLWIRNISNLFNGITLMCQGVLGWILLYGTRQEWLTGIMLNLSYITTTPGNLIAPAINKRFSKRTSIVGLKSLVLLLQCGFLLMIPLRSDTMKIVVFMCFSLVSSLLNSAQSVINNSTIPDIWDYQQWRTGERLEASSDLFGYVSTPLAMLLGYVSPYLLKAAGLVSDWDIMYDTVIRDQVIALNIIVSIFGVLLMVLPFLFGDVTPEKHRQIQKELRERAGETEPDGEEEMAQ